jgi:hypothetical protein
VARRRNGGEFVLDCLTGSIHGRCEGNAVAFTWNGSDETEPASGHGWAEMLDDGSLEGEICLECGDEIPFIARRPAHFLNSLLGHSDTRMVEKHDGHLAPSYISDAVRAHAPRFVAAADGKVEKLGRRAPSRTLR